MNHEPRSCEESLSRRTGLRGSRSQVIFNFWAVLIVAITETVSTAFEEPTVNLGASTFFDGMAAIEKGKADPGWYFDQYLQYYRADKFKNVQGQTIPGTPRLDVYTSLTQLIYLFEKPDLLGAHLGIDALIPVVKLDASPANSFLNANGSVLGDLTIGPAIQFDPIMMDGHPVFMHRLDLDVIVPTGSYDRKYALNPGANFVSFNPYWAGTLFLGSKVVTSWRLHYLLNDANEEPNLALYPPGTQKVQAGQAVHLNFATAYDLYDHRIYAGLNGYYFKQISETRINARAIAGLEEQVLGIGPGAMLNLRKNMNVFLNLYFETAVENRPQGIRLNTLFAYHF